MSSINDGGPAYPHDEYQPSGHCRQYFGMSLRDYFAGQALIALPHRGCGADLDHHDTAIAAYQMADAMLKAREVKP
jgi:hypothetical protein